MTIREAQLTLERFTYKPGWKLEIVYPATLRISFKTADSNAPNRVTTVLFEQGISDYDVMFLTETQFRWFVFECIRRAEDHEIAEWLRFDGVRVTDPHPIQTLT